MPIREIDRMVSPTLRRLLRRVVPAAIRWRLRLLARQLADRRSGVNLACGRADPAAFPHLVCRYERPLICYPGQGAHFAAKRGNNARALGSIDRLVILPGETFSFWGCVGRPAARTGYQPAAALKNRLQIEDVGGALCLASTLLYNVGLLSGMAIVERQCHSVDQYGDDRYFELGRDAAVEYAYLDLRYRNDLRLPIMLRTYVGDGTIVGEAWAPEPLSLDVAIEVDAPTCEPPPRVTMVDRALSPGTCVVEEAGLPGVVVRARRRRAVDGTSRLDDLGLSVHHARPRLERTGP